jgi:hypothetical protein
MKALSLLAVGCVLSLAGPAPAQKDDLKKQIVGRWEATLKDTAGMDYSVVIDFKADGKTEGTARGVPFKGTYRFTKDDEIESETTTKDGVTTKTTQTVKITGDMMEWKDAKGTFKFKKAR